MKATAAAQEPINPQTLHRNPLKAAETLPPSWSHSIRSCISQKRPKQAISIYIHGRAAAGAAIAAIPSVLKACASLSLLDLGRSLHADILKSGAEGDLMVGTALVDMYGKCGDVPSSRQLFDHMPLRSVVSWNAMIGSYMRNGRTHLASVLFADMPGKTAATWHEMIGGLARVGDTSAARGVFERVPEYMRSVVTWTVMVSGYAANGNMEAAQEVFGKMPGRNFYVWSVMITGYFRAGDFAKARELFDEMGSRNVVVWNSLISGYAQNGMSGEVFGAFQKMQEEGFEPDEVTLASVLSACSQSGRLDIGREVHRIIQENRIELNEFILNGLVDMYAKCGDLETARSIFDAIPAKNTATWNSLIAGFAIHGKSQEAVEMFRKMEGSNEKPDSITFLSVLSACGHGGFVDVGLEAFSKMGRYYSNPTIKHYGCLVDLLGRAGRLREAFEVIKGMPMAPNGTVLGTMLGACRIHSDATMAEKVMDELVGKLCSENGSHHEHYVLLSGIYAESERWEMAEEARVIFSSVGAEKTPGHSALVI